MRAENADRLPHTGGTTIWWLWRGANELSTEGLIAASESAALIAAAIPAQPNLQPAQQRAKKGAATRITTINHNIKHKITMNHHIQAYLCIVNDTHWYVISSYTYIIMIALIT